MNFHYENYTLKAPKIRGFKVFLAIDHWCFSTHFFILLKKGTKKELLAKTALIVFHVEYKLTNSVYLKIKTSEKPVIF